MPNVTLVDTSTVPIGTTGNPLYVNSASGVTEDVNLSEVAGAAVKTGAGTASGAQRVELPTDGTGKVGLNAGSAVVGKVGIDQTTPGTTNAVQVIAQAGVTSYSTAVTLTRTNDTNVYAANDVIGAATGSTAALTFATMGPSAGLVTIKSVTFEVDITAVVSGMTSFNLQLYSITPPSALGDNAAWDLPSGDRASYLGSVNLGTPVDLGSTLFVETNALSKIVLLAGTSLFGYLVTVGTWTPAASTVFKITLFTSQVS
jgi:hypothetical protein